MSELVEIKAEGLKWCNRSFRFLDHRLLNIMGVDSEFIYSTGVRFGIIKHTMDTTVLVNPQEYEEAVIARIKDMFNGEVYGIKKCLNTEYGFGPAVICYVHCFGFRDTVHILADPRPWEESYTIELTD